MEEAQWSGPVVDGGPTLRCAYCGEVAFGGPMEILSLRPDRASRRVDPRPGDKVMCDGCGLASCFDRSPLGASTLRRLTDAESATLRANQQWQTARSDWRRERGINLPR